MPAKTYNAERVKDIPRFAAAALLCAIVAALPKAAAAGAAEGVELCLSHVIPPLFPLMFAVIFMTECGASAALAGLLAPVCSRLFGLSGCSGAAVAAAMLGGYPAGAKTAAEMYDSGMISREEAARISMFCFGAGPAFILGTLGSVLPVRSAYLLLAAQPVSIVLCGVVLRLFGRRRDKSAPEYRENIKSPRPLADCVVSSAGKTASALLEICGFVVLFSALGAVLDALGCSAAVEFLLKKAGAAPETAKAALPVLLEVTRGSVKACSAGLPLAAFALGFGGLSVHTQIYGITRRIGLDPAAFTLMRLFQGAVSAALTRLYMVFLPACGAAASADGVRLTSHHPAGAVTLFVLCVMLVMCGDDLLNTEDLKLKNE